MKLEVFNSFNFFFLHGRIFYFEYLFILFLYAEIIISNYVKCKE